jgi:uncharacterized protein YeaO (DUF488 family)
VTGGRFRVHAGALRSEALMRIAVKRVYEEPHRSDGLRVLVDRLWPRGIRKEELLHDRWLKEVAPSTELRKWYGHRPDRFREFARRYRREIRSGKASEALEDLRGLSRGRPVTLLTATRDVDRSGAQVLADVLSQASEDG